MKIFRHVAIVSTWVAISSCVIFASQQSRSQDEHIRATIEFSRLIPEAEFSGAGPNLPPVDLIWVGAETDTGFQGGQQVIEKGELLEGLRDYQEDVKSMNIVLNRTKPDPSIEVPEPEQFGVYALSVYGTSESIQQVTEIFHKLDPYAKLHKADYVPRSPARSSKSTGACKQESSAKPIGPRPRPKQVLPCFPYRGTANHFWIPDSGEVHIDQLNSGERYVVNWIKWDDSTSLAGLRNGNTKTYEQETVFNNYDGLRYLGTYRNARWSLPRGYKDTPASDSSSEPNLTVGSASAKDIQQGTWYFTAIVCRNGNSSSDTAKLQGQLGHRTPSWCYSTWCIFAESTYRIYSAWQLSAPIHRSWRIHGNRA